jgi:Protein of unknown function (DUF2380)
MIRLTYACCVCMAITLATAAAAQAATKAAIFPVELIDVSLEGEFSSPRADEANRLILATAELRRLAAGERGYEVLDLSRINAELGSAAPLYKCNGCELELARKLGADVAITAVVRKVSNLLLIFYIQVRDVASGSVTRVYRVDMRGNTDESWLRGARWLIARGLAGG